LLVFVTTAFVLQVATSALKAQRDSASLTAVDDGVLILAAIRVLVINFSVLHTGEGKDASLTGARNLRLVDPVFVLPMVVVDVVR